MKRELDSDQPKLKDLSLKRVTAASTALTISKSVDALEEKVEKNRERNREHAKKTRLRKKEMIEGMKMRLLELQRETVRLEQLLEESNTASILLCLGSKGDVADKPDNLAQSLAGATPQEIEDIRTIRALMAKGNLIDQLRQKVRADAAKMVQMRDQLDSHSSSPSRKSDSPHETDTNTTVESVGETSSYHSDEVHRDAARKLDGSEEEDGADSHDEGDEGESEGEGDHPKHGGSGDLGKQKRERNRVHAKLTRDRKKLFTMNMQHAMQTLERYHHLMRQQLDRILRGSASIGHSTVAVDSAPVPKIVTTPLLPTHPHAMYAVDAHAAALLHSAFAPMLLGMESYAPGAAAMWSLTHPFPFAATTSAAPSRFPSMILPAKKKAKTSY